MEALEKKTEGEKVTQDAEEDGTGDGHGFLPKHVSLLVKDFATEQEAT